jgi:hypothetical protein
MRKQLYFLFLLWSGFSFGQPVTALLTYPSGLKLTSADCPVPDGRIVCASEPVSVAEPAEIILTHSDPKHPKKAGRTSTSAADVKPTHSGHGPVMLFAVIQAVTTDRRRSAAGDQ